MSNIEDPESQNDNNSRPTESTPLLASTTEQYSVFTKPQKQLIILAAALASAFSPLSANIYFPALNSIAKDLRVTPSQINLTITTYMICQGIAPTFTGSLADQAGRRPAYIYCFIVYIASNIALATQHWFPALLLLRAVQSCGSSGTVALASAVAADIITPAERGAYMGIASLGNILAPSLGPVAGGLLSRTWGWRSIFWFLAIISSGFFLLLLLFFPETCRAIVSDGTVIPEGYLNRPLWRLFSCRKRLGTDNMDLTVRPQGPVWNIPNPGSSLRLLCSRPVGLLLFANGVIFGSYYAVTAGIPSQFEELYGLDDFGIGLCFIPAGLGSLFSAAVNGFAVDWNYRRIGKQFKDSTTLDSSKIDILKFPVEQARLQICLPMALLAASSIAVYGLLIAHKCALWVSLLMVFAICFCITAAYNVMNVLIVDLYYSTPATAMAANNLVRCSMGAAAAAIINQLIQRVGVKWAYRIVAANLLSIVPLLVLVYFKGWSWRRVNAGT